MYKLTNNAQTTTHIISWNMDTADIVVIGAGVVGLAVAAELAGRFPTRSIVVLERNAKFGQETSSRNSEVIHAGIYYPPKSLKARLCVEGKRLLYEFCSKWQVPCKRFGKLIVANTRTEVATLESLLIRGKENGVDDLQLFSRTQVACREPDIQAEAAIYSPSTGIVDTHRLMARLEWLAQEKKVLCAYLHEATGIEHQGNSSIVQYLGPGKEHNSLKTTWLINSAGLASDHVASLMDIDIDQAGYRLHPCKGEYFNLSSAKSKRISHLIYPPPYKDLRGLGIHVTKMLDGRVKLGPNAFYIDELDYTVDVLHAEEFYANIKEYLPFVEPHDLQPDTAGIRPKLQAPGAPIHDFIVRHESERGLHGVINLIGIESPGLTACLSLAKMVGDIIEQGKQEKVVRYL